MPEGRKFVSLAVLLLTVHIAGILGLSFWVPNLTYGTPFVIPAMVTTAVITIGSYLWGVLSVSDAADVLTLSPRKALLVQRAFFGSYSLFVILWLLVPMCCLSVAHTTTAFVVAIITGICYVGTFALTMLADPNHY